MARSRCDFILRDTDDRRADGVSFDLHGPAAATRAERRETWKG